MSLNVLVVKPDGSYIGLESTDAVATAGHFCKGFVERLGEAFHALAHYEVWHADDFLGHEVNLVASELVGMDLMACAPLHGPVIIARLADGQDNTAERVHQQEYFGAAAMALKLISRESEIDYLLHR